MIKTSSDIPFPDPSDDQGLQPPVWKLRRHAAEPWSPEVLRFCSSCFVHGAARVLDSWDLKVSSPFDLEVSSMIFAHIIFQDHFLKIFSRKFPSLTYILTLSFLALLSQNAWSPFRQQPFLAQGHNTGSALCVIAMLLAVPLPPHHLFCFLVLALFMLKVLYKYVQSHSFFF